MDLRELKHVVLIVSTQLVSKTARVIWCNSGMKLLNDLEDFRERNGLAKADMARRFDVPLQNYNNWVYRNSLPKDKIDLAHEILASEKPKGSRGILTKIAREAADLSERELAEVLAQIDLIKRRQRGEL